MIFGFRKRSKKWQLLTIVSVVGFAYISVCVFLLFRQRYFIYRPKLELSMLPSAAAFNLPYEDVLINISGGCSWIERRESRLCHYDGWSANHLD